MEGEPRAMRAPRMEPSNRNNSQVISAMDGADAYEALDGDTWPDFVFLDYTLNVGDSGDEVSGLGLHMGEI